MHEHTLIYRGLIVYMLSWSWTIKSFSPLCLSLFPPPLSLAHAYPVTAAVFAPVPGITVDEGLRDIGEVVVAGDYQGHIKVYVNSDDL